MYATSASSKRATNWASCWWPSVTSMRFAVVPKRAPNVVARPDMPWPHPMIDSAARGLRAARATSVELRATPNTQVPTVRRPFASTALLGPITMTSKKPAVRARSDTLTISSPMNRPPSASTTSTSTPANARPRLPKDGEPATSPKRSAKPNATCTRMMQT